MSRSEEHSRWREDSAGRSGLRATRIGAVTGVLALIATVLLAVAQADKWPITGTLIWISYAALVFSVGWGFWAAWAARQGEDRVLNHLRDAEEELRQARADAGRAASIAAFELSRVRSAASRDVAAERERYAEMRKERNAALGMLGPGAWSPNTSLLAVLTRGCLASVTLSGDGHASLLCNVVVYNLAPFEVTIARASVTLGLCGTLEWRQMIGPLTVGPRGGSNSWLVESTVASDDFQSRPLALLEAALHIELVAPWATTCDLVARPIAVHVQELQ